MIRHASHSEAGGHLKNEDAFLVRPFPDKGEGYLVALADGQGGRAGAARAATLACQTCLETAANDRIEQLLVPATWIDILRKADEAVNKDSAAGFTTLVAFCITPEFLCGASCGDSAASLHQPASDAMVLTAGQFKNPPVDSGEVTFVPFAARLESPWTVLAMSDGVWKYAGWQNILNLDPTRNVEEIVPTILARARMPSGGLQDDFTLVAFQHTQTC